MTAVDRPSRLHAVPDPGAEQPGPMPSTLTIRPWWDPSLASSGFDPRSEYVERFWLGVLGPSVVLLIRRLARGLSEHPEGFSVDLGDTARALGLSTATGRNAPMPRTLDRACMFSVMRRVGEAEYDARTHLPRLTQRQLNRLPAVVRSSHRVWLEHHDRARVPRPPAA